MPSARNLDSPKMRQLQAILADGQEHTSWELTRALRICDLTLVRELRTHGYEIPCRHTGTHGIYRYTTADLELHITHERARLATEGARLNALQQRTAP